MAIDAHDNIIVADGSCIRKVATDGTVSTMVGSNEGAEGWLDGPADKANFEDLLSLVIDPGGNIIVVDCNDDGET